MTERGSGTFGMDEGDQEEGAPSPPAAKSGPQAWRSCCRRRQGGGGGSRINGDQRCINFHLLIPHCDVCVFSADHRNAPQIVIIYAIEAVSSFFPGPVLVPEGP